MKNLIYLIISILLIGCQKYEHESEPSIFMGGGKWVFIDYDVVVINSHNNVEVLKNDTICINSFSDFSLVSGGLQMSQTYNNTSITRRFIKNKTMWEFDSFHLYCDWLNMGGGQIPSHEPFWVTYPRNGLYKNYTKMSILDHTIGLKTDYTFETNNIGVSPPTKLTLISPEIVTDLYFSNGGNEKAVTVRIILKFIR
jgi:hypothetical protein